MLTVRELKALARQLTDADFTRQLGAFVLIERPFRKEGVELDQGPRITAPIKQRPAQSVFDFDDLWVAALPPLEATDSLLVGRAPDADIVLDEATVSKHHARVWWLGKHAELEELGSSNGTLVNGVKVQARIRLTDNDVIEFGGVQVQFLLVQTLREKMNRRSGAGS